MEQGKNFTASDQHAATCLRGLCKYLPKRFAKPSEMIKKIFQTISKMEDLKEHRPSLKWAVVLFLPKPIEIRSRNLYNEFTQNRRKNVGFQP